jgi:TfoX/Sxy family transcriptional regulator of competence genes
MFPAMNIPKPADQVIRTFEDLTPEDPAVTRKKLFGQPAAFVNGNLFLGVFGEVVFVRLSPADRAEVQKTPGFHPFEPMKGRPMSEYVVLPPVVLKNQSEARRWVARSVRYAAALPAKKTKSTKKAR